MIAAMTGCSGDKKTAAPDSGTPQANATDPETPAADVTLVVFNVPGMH